MKRCEKTWSGKHLFNPELLYKPVQNPFIKKMLYEVTGIDYLKCIACGLIDDRPTPGKKEKHGS